LFFAVILNEVKDTVTFHPPIPFEPSAPHNQPLPLFHPQKIVISTEAGHSLTLNSAVDCGYSRSFQARRLQAGCRWMLGMPE
jgi:hypothetical protein